MMLAAFDSVRERWNGIIHERPVVGFIDACLRGAAQVTLQNNPITGVFILAALLVASAESGSWGIIIGAVVGLVVGTGTALILRADRESYHKGLFGFSPLLTGVALGSFLTGSVLQWFYVVVGTSITTVVTLELTKILSNWDAPPLTFPFVLTTWFMFAGAYQFGRIGYGTLTPPALATVPLPPGHDQMSTDAAVWISSMLKGVSQVFLTDSWIGGIIILVGLFINYWLSALSALMGAVIATLIAILVGAGVADIEKGIWGFSSVLTAIALGSVLYKPSPRVTLFAVFGVIATVVIQAGLTTLLAPAGLITLTAPFVFATWLFLLPSRDVEQFPHHERLDKDVLDSEKPDSP